MIERYKNEDANIVTAKNISPGGNRYKLLQESFNYHTLGKVTVIGGFTQKLIDFNKMINEDDRVENIILPLRDGLNVILKN